MTLDRLVFVEATRITTEQPDLTPVFGTLTPDQKDSLLASLRRAEDSLFAFRDLLAAESDRWECRGVTLDTYPSGQASITGYVENPNGLSFGVELAPKNSWDGAPWEPGQERKVMSYEGWDLTGEVWATPDRYGNTVVGELPPRRANNPESACEALLDVCQELRELAFRRPPTNEAWLVEESDRT